MALQDADALDSQASDVARPALPAGDPLAWSVLVAGTSLESMSWPGWGSSGWDAPTEGHRI